MLKRKKNGTFAKGYTPFNKGLKMSEGTRMPAGEIGGTGTSITSGIISDVDYNAEWVGTNRITIIDKMRKGDATVRAACLSVILPIVSANWFVKPASDDPTDQEIAKRVGDNLFSGMNRTWAETLREIMLYTVYGCYPFEIVYETKPDGMIGWQKFAPRHPSTIYKWEITGGKNGITQILTDGNQPEIPIEKLIIFVNEKEGDNWEGNSILRPAYSAWYHKDNLYRILAIQIERQGTSLPMIMMPQGTSTTDFSKAEELLKNMRQNEEAYFIGRRDEKGNEIKPEFLDMKASSTKDPMEFILHLDRQIVKSVLAQHIELGATDSGSRALSEDQSSVFEQNEKSFARHVAEAVNTYAIKRLVDLNWNVTKYPTLEFSDLGRTNYQILSSSILNLVNAGILTTDTELEDYLRDIMDLPKRPQQDQANQTLQRVNTAIEAIEKELDANKNLKVRKN